ncbi:retron St85 family effector protein [Lysobacter hankyongensis]|uniref:Uncharacterized protein n=1 Tax=Lysobacter hankyongensis TaxID=1176535 RepID=A0ABP9CCJ6_9GAMM
MNVKDDPAFTNLFELTAGLFIQAGLRFSSTPLITFVCGGTDEFDSPSIRSLPGYPQWVMRMADIFRADVPKQLSFRKRFIDWALVNEPRLACVRAETAITDLMGAIRVRGKTDDLAEVETIIADVCDRILLFCESPGSLAELGIFCMNEKISGITLVVLPEQHQGGSFINRGPVARIARQSNFVPAVIGADYVSVFRGISQRLTADPPHNENFDSSLWDDLTLRQKFCIIDMLLDISGVLTDDDLKDIVRRIAGKFDYWEVQLLVGIILALGRGARTKSGFLARVARIPPERFILGQDKNFRDMKARWISRYRKSGLPQYLEYMEVNR